MSKLNDQIVEAFVSNPKEDKLHVTPDGNCFREKDKSHADWHAKTSGQKVKTVNREDFESEIESFTEVKKESKAKASKAAKAEAEEEEATAKAKAEKEEEAAVKAKAKAEAEKTGKNK